MRLYNEMLDDASPEGLQVWELAGGALPACHVYMEAQVFTPDGRCVVLHEGTDPHGAANLGNPHHRYLLCDLGDGGCLSPLTTELNCTAPAVSPDGRWLYYFVDSTMLPGPTGDVRLRRVSLDGRQRETICVLDTPFVAGPRTAPGAVGRRAGRLYPLSTLSSDGRRLATQCHLGDGLTPDAPFGLLVFDLERCTADCIFTGADYLNMHPQYCRSSDPDESRWLLIQHNHGNHTDAMGRPTDAPLEDLGADLHLLNDDGTDLRDLACGRNGTELLQGHQCWIGTSPVALVGNDFHATRHQHLIAATGIPGAARHTGAAGLATRAGGQRAVVTASQADAQFCHFQTDPAGRRVITDHNHPMRAWQLYLGELPADPLTAGVESMRYLLTTGSRIRTSAGHTHPFLSPDGRTGFFNSDITGQLRAYCVTGL